MTTAENLKNAFAGESQANRKYLAFAKKADEEGYDGAAKLFRAAAEAETVHAHSHLNAMGGIRSTKENLQEAIEGETHEFTTMYPAMIREAKKEELKKAWQSFENANSVEIIHAALYKKALINLESDEEVDYYVCQICGNTVEKQAPGKCSICGAPDSSFTKIG